MNRLEAELRRLYFVATPAQQGPDTNPPGLIGSDGCVRALVLELASPANWSELARVWQGVQAELDMPAPAIVVSGQRGCQLWFSLVQPVTSDVARAFLDALQTRYLADVAPERIQAFPAPDASRPSRVRHIDALPPAQVADERWSAFVAPDLAPLFDDEPWLDHPPGVDAQADLLSRVASASPEAFGRACERLHATQPAAAPAPGRHGAANPAARSESPGRLREPHATPGSVAPCDVTPADAAFDARSFLLAVMRDPSVDLSLRIEAAKALLPLAGT
jgi:hypothetical protein